jgi:hypothetical protein
MAEDRPDEQNQEQAPELPEPEFESTLEKLNRGALPPDDPIVRLHEAIEGLRAIKF